LIKTLVTYVYMEAEIGLNIYMSCLILSLTVQVDNICSYLFASKRLYICMYGIG